MTLQSDDGKPLQPIEGIIVDQEGRPLNAPRASVRSFSFSMPLPAMIGAAIFIPLALATGIAFFGVIVILLAIFFIFSSIARFLRNP
jgi:hypothetical protein